MVCEWGMSERLGPLTYGQKDEEVFLGKQIARHKNYSEETAVAIDEEIKGIVTRCMNRAEQILRENIEVLHRLAAALLEREILDANEIDLTIKGSPLPPIPSGGNGHDDEKKRVSTSGEGGVPGPA
jgi:cell division protease FtsH